MIIFGTREGTTGMKAVSGHSCRYCGTKESLSVLVRAAYFHIFWIPVFPYGKKVYSVCGHCRQYLSRLEMPPDLGAKATQVARTIKTPWYYFLVLILAAALFLVSSVIGIIGS